MIAHAPRVASIGMLILLAAVGSSARADDASSLVGSWSWSYKDAQGVTHKHVLEVEGTGDKVAARERMDEEDAVKVTDLKVVDKTVTFSVLRGKRRASYNGKLKEKDRIEGEVSVSDDGQPKEFGWEAKKDEEKKQ